MPRKSAQYPAWAIVEGVQPAPMRKCLNSLLMCSSQRFHEETRPGPSITFSTVPPLSSGCGENAGSVTVVDAIVPPLKRSSERSERQGTRHRSCAEAGRHAITIDFRAPDVLLEMLKGSCRHQLAPQACVGRAFSRRKLMASSFVAYRVVLFVVPGHCDPPGRRRSRGRQSPPLAVRFRMCRARVARRGLCPARASPGKKLDVNFPRECPHWRARRPPCEFFRWIHSLKVRAFFRSSAASMAASRLNEILSQRLGLGTSRGPINDLVRLCGRWHPPGQTQPATR